LCRFGACAPTPSPGSGSQISLRIETHSIVVSILSRRLRLMRILCISSCSAKRSTISCNSSALLLYWSCLAMSERAESRAYVARNLPTACFRSDPSFEFGFTSLSISSSGLSRNEGLCCVGFYRKKFFRGHLKSFGEL